MINLVFEDIENLRNLFDENEMLGNGMYRITTSPYANHLRRLSTHFSRLNHGNSVIEYNLKKYEISGVFPHIIEEMILKELWSLKINNKDVKFNTKKLVEEILEK